MQLAQLLADLPRVLAQTGDLATPITAITADSRQITPGALFVAYRGIAADGHRFIPDALARGAAAVVGEEPGLDLPVPYIQVADGREALAWLAAAWHGHPSRSMALVGITGTDGKTTTANLLYSILKAAGRRAGLISTVNAVIGEQVYDTGLHTTTPDAPDVQRYLAQMRDAGAEVAVLEATSHGLAQHRVSACALDVAVITNITHEHLDFHGSYEAYRDAKALLFRSLTAQKPGLLPKPGFPDLPKTAVLNRDDSSFEFLAAIPAERVITYGVGEGESVKLADWQSGGTGLTDVTTCWPSASYVSAVDLTARNIRHSPSGIQFDLCLSAAPPIHQSTILSLTSPLVGAFNVYNILAATGAALALGVGPDAIQAGVAEMKGVPGRMERVVRGQPFTAIVDFAHTPNALARALETGRELVGAGGRVIAVFGCAGLRDREKRRLMGEVASRLADVSVVTAEDPRTEELAAIMAETAAALAAGGREEGRDFVRIADRQRAILHAVRLARPGDVVLVCGKGHEQSMCFGETEYPWRDQDALAWALDTLRGAATDVPPFVLPTWAVQNG
jgi:UDP-N-acetylmuramoyl-L-alanyl-D-glutamate--2,6-diaminopimelate ligase